MPDVYYVDDVKMSAYYRGQDKQLHQINCYERVENIHLVFQGVMEHLHDTKQIFFKPILILIKGGKG